MTQQMSETEYLSFAECRKASFSSQPAKFKQWLLQDFSGGSDLVFQLDPLAIEAFQYLAYETIAEV